MWRAQPSFTSQAEVLSSFASQLHALPPHGLNATQALQFLAAALASLMDKQSASMSVSSSAEAVGDKNKQADAADKEAAAAAAAAAALRREEEEEEEHEKAAVLRSLLRLVCGRVQGVLSAQTKSLAQHANGSVYRVTDSLMGEPRTHYLETDPCLVCFDHDKHEKQQQQQKQTQLLTTVDRQAQGGGSGSGGSREQQQRRALSERASSVLGAASLFF
jgi:hypothetical protein